MMADYLDFIALKQREGREMSLLAVEEEFAATQNFNSGQRRRLNFIARTYLEHEWAGPRFEVSYSNVRPVPIPRSTAVSTVFSTAALTVSAAASA